jgi:predicted ATPase
MGRTRRRQTTLRAPYLKRVWLDRSRVEDWEAYPFCLPVFRDEFDQSFDSAVTIIVGENGTGKSTILEGIADWLVLRAQAAARVFRRSTAAASKSPAKSCRLPFVRPGCRK